MPMCELFYTRTFCDDAPNVYHFNFSIYRKDEDINGVHVIDEDGNKYVLHIAFYMFDDHSNTD